MITRNKAIVVHTMDLGSEKDDEKENLYKLWISTDRDGDGDVCAEVYHEAAKTGGRNPE